MLLIFQFNYVSPKVITWKYRG